MDTPTITATPDSGLTATKYMADFAIITGHQITRADFATTFSWGSDIVLDGFGLSSVRHINGTMVFATAFGNGNDSAAIQLAVNFVATSSPGRGVVYVNALPGGARWAMSTAVTLASGVDVIGIGWPILNKTVGSAMFVVDGCRDNVISGFVVDGNNTSGGLASGTDCSNITIRGNVIGVPGDTATTRLMNGPMFLASGSSSECLNLRVVDNYCHEQNELVDFFDVRGVEVSRNQLYATRGVSSTGPAIRLRGCLGVKVQNNWLKLRGESGGASGPAGGIHLDAGSLNAITKHVVVDGNFIWGGNGHGIYLNNVQAATIAGNTVANVGIVVAANTYDGIHVQASAAGNSKGIVVHDNVSTNFPGNVIGDGGGGMRYGVSVDANTTDISVLRNFLELIDDAPNPATHFLCDTAGIQFLATTRSFRDGNIIMLDQKRPDSPWLNHQAANAERFTVRGIRTLAGDAARHNQVLGVQVSTVRAAVTAASPLVVGWWRDPTGGGAGATKFDTANAINVNTNSADLTATQAEWRISVEVLA